jgi:hypothetical protein
MLEISVKNENRWQQKDRHFLLSHHPWLRLPVSPSSGMGSPLTEKEKLKGKNRCIDEERHLGSVAVLFTPPCR